MFTGLIQQLGQIVDIQHSGLNKTFSVRLKHKWDDIKIDESIAHDGVCLTVVDHDQDLYQVTAIEETLKITTAHAWTLGTELNIERAMQAHERLGGHFVQGHVDGLAECISIIDKNGSKEIVFRVPVEKASLIVQKGSITLNGISLTIFNITDDTFTVAIIPYTWEHTTLKYIKTGDVVNIEYDIIGKYMQRSLELYSRK